MKKILILFVCVFISLGFALESAESVQESETQNSQDKVIDTNNQELERIDLDNKDYKVVNFEKDNKLGSVSNWSIEEKMRNGSLNGLLANAFVCSAETKEVIDSLVSGRNYIANSGNFSNTSVRKMSQILEKGKGDYQLLQRILESYYIDYYMQPFRLIEKSGFYAPCFAENQCKYEDIAISINSFIETIGTGHITSIQNAQEQGYYPTRRGHMEPPQSPQNYTYDYYVELYDRFEDYKKVKKQELLKDRAQNTRKILDSMCAKVANVELDENRKAQVFFDNSKVKSIEAFEPQMFKLRTLEILQMPLELNMGGNVSIQTK